MALGWLVMVGLAANFPSVDGGISLSQVEEMAAWHSAEINTCLAGTSKRAAVNYRFIVRADGRIGQFAFLDSRDVESARVTCVGTSLEKWRFPSSDGGAVVQWSFSKTTVDAGVAGEEQIIAPEEMAPTWVDAASACYDAVKPNVQREGLASLSVTVLPSGAPVQSSVGELSPALTDTELARCLEERALGWPFPPGPFTRKLQLNWTFATSERRAKGHFNPSAPGREIISHQPSLVPAGEGLDKDVIMAVIKKHTRWIRDCYDAALRLHPGLGGKFAVAWEIGPAGKVVKSEPTADELHDERFTACVLAVIDQMQFPPPKGGGQVNVTFPWIFKGAGE